MATITNTRKMPSGQTLEKSFAAAAANTAVVLTTPTGQAKHLLSIFAHYSAPPTHAGITVTYGAGQGAAYNTLLDTSPANAQDYAYTPADEDIVISDDDAREGLAILDEALTVADSYVR